MEARFFWLEYQRLAILWVAGKKVTFAKVETLEIWTHWIMNAYWEMGQKLNNVDKASMLLCINTNKAYRKFGFDGDSKKRRRRKIGYIYEEIIYFQQMIRYKAYKKTGQARDEGVSTKRSSTSKEFKRRSSVEIWQCIWKARVEGVKRVIDNWGGKACTRVKVLGD